ncbi:MAG: metallophosphoesterase family protein [Anaerolineae bacterium]|nr:metallophosphoesterase family protein [Anaerolineae bacterium]
MRISIISDTHDDAHNLEAALEALRAESVTKILHCGDVCGPGLIQALAGFDVWIAQGNMDRHFGLAQVVEETLGRGWLAWLHRLTVDVLTYRALHPRIRKRVLEEQVVIL